MITKMLIAVSDPDVDDSGNIFVRYTACGVTAAGVRGKISGSIVYQFGATLAQKQTALLNRAKAEIPVHFPGATFSASLAVEYLGL